MGEFFLFLIASLLIAGIIVFCSSNTENSNPYIEEPKQKYTPNPVTGETEKIYYFEVGVDLEIDGEKYYFKPCFFDSVEKDIDVEKEKKAAKNNIDSFLSSALAKYNYKASVSIELKEGFDQFLREYYPTSFRGKLSELKNKLYWKDHESTKLFKQLVETIVSSECTIRFEGLDSGYETLYFKDFVISIEAERKAIHFRTTGTKLFVPEQYCRREVKMLREHYWKQQSEIMAKKIAHINTKET